MRKTLKISYSIIRAPKLIDMFHKAERERISAVRIADFKQEAFLKLR